MKIKKVDSEIVITFKGKEYLVKRIPVGSDKLKKAVRGLEAKGCIIKEVLPKSFFLNSWYELVYLDPELKEVK